MKNASRTINPLHFEDLEPHRFEDLIRQLAYGYRSWRNLEATGRLGSDGGVDIHGIEVVQAIAESVEADDDPTEEGTEFIAGPILEERHWRFQCKRYQTIGPKLMREIVKETVPDPSAAPYGLIVAAACDVSEKAMASFHDERVKRGVSEGHVWSKAHLEDILFRPENDHLLFAYFGISLVTKRRSQIRSIQTKLTIKRKAMRALGMNKVTDSPCKDILIRNVDDIYYPHEDDIKGFGEMDFSPWHTATIDRFHFGGIILELFAFRGWFKPDGSWDITQRLRTRCGEWMDSRRQGHQSEEEQAARAKKYEEEQAILDNVPESERAVFSAYLLLPYSAILEIDPWGDPVFEGPHFFCQFNGLEWGPYAPDTCYLEYRKNQYSVQYLQDEHRKPLFEPFLPPLSKEKN